MANTAPKKTSREDWHPADIKAALNKRDWTLAALAASHGLEKSTITHALQRSYPKAEQIIAEAIGVCPSEIWPTRWNQDGTKKPRGADVLKFTAREKARHGRAAAVAGNVAVGG